MYYLDIYDEVHTNIVLGYVGCVWWDGCYMTGEFESYKVKTLTLIMIKSNI